MYSFGRVPRTADHVGQLLATLNFYRNIVRKMIRQKRLCVCSGTSTNVMPGLLNTKIWLHFIISLQEIHDITSHSPNVPATDIAITTGLHACENIAILVHSSFSSLPIPISSTLPTKSRRIRFTRSQPLTSDYPSFLRWFQRHKIQQNTNLATLIMSSITSFNALPPKCKSTLPKIPLISIPPVLPIQLLISRSALPHLLLAWSGKRFSISVTANTSPLSYHDQHSDHITLKNLDFFSCSDYFYEIISSTQTNFKRRNCCSFQWSLNEWPHTCEAGG